MKTFEVVVPTIVVAKFVICKTAFEAKFNGLPSKLEAFIKNAHPEYEKCSSTWRWETSNSFSIGFMSSGDPVIHVIKEK